MRKSKREPNKYLSAFLFGHGKPSSTIYIHFARRFTYFKEGLSSLYFNWHAWLLAPFYSIYRGLYRRAFTQLILLVIVSIIIICSGRWWLSVGSIGCWLMMTNLMAYRSDYSLYRLYLKKIEQYDVKNRGDEGLKQLLRHGGRHYGVLIVSIMMTAAVIGLIYYYKADIMRVIELLYGGVKEQLARLHHRLSDFFEEYY